MFVMHGHQLNKAIQAGSIISFHNQKKIQSELYNGLQDHAAQDPNLDLGNVGQSIILPSSHTGSPCYMQQLLQDSLAIC